MPQPHKLFLLRFVYSNTGVVTRRQTVKVFVVSDVIMLSLQSVKCNLNLSVTKIIAFDRAQSCRSCSYKLNGTYTIHQFTAVKTRSISKLFVSSCFFDIGTWEICLGCKILKLSFKHSLSLTLWCSLS